MFSALISGMRADFTKFSSLAEHFHMLANYEQPHIDRATTQADRRYHEGKHHAFVSAFDLLNTVAMRPTQVSWMYPAPDVGNVTIERYIADLEANIHNQMVTIDQLRRRVAEAEDRWTD